MTGTADTSATVIIGQRVRPGREQAFEAWQLNMNREAAKYPGFIGAEINRPTAVQSDWVNVYRFDSIAHVQAWLNSATRQELLLDAEQYFEGPGTQQIVGGGGRRTDPLVTVVVTHRVDPADVDEFLAWQERLRLAENAFPGFRGTELFRPVEGAQEEWTALYRYSTADDLDRWLISNERKELLAEGEKFKDYQSRTVDNSFGNWFAFDDKGAEAPPPSNFKSSVAVWVGVYPAVVLITLALWPLRLPMWINLLIGNLLSSLALSYFVMPHFVNPLLKNWLRPPPDVSVTISNWRGFALVFAVMTILSTVFYILTRVVLHLH
ncbi:antibiotic biosynthesis monooxygenase [Mycobacterium sp. NPDC051804]|uniref:antibiotic biosynthesis monooxygenase n=1 Tax=Mycobacterium sp. NPDC051804 TaxID=3364295 RepID=UPI0037A4EAFD